VVRHEVEELDSDNQAGCNKLLLAFSKYRSLCLKTAQTSARAFRCHSSLIGDTGVPRIDLRLHSEVAITSCDEPEWEGRETKSERKRR